jgi:hypothetical protein
MRLIISGVSMDRHWRRRTDRAVRTADAACTAVSESAAALGIVNDAGESRRRSKGDREIGWPACALSGQPTLYAAFIDIESPVVILLRRAVRFDDCGQHQYEPLTGPPPVQDRAPGPARKK